MKPISEQRKAVMKDTLLGKVLTVREIRTGIKTKNGERAVFTVTADKNPDLIDFFGTPALEKQDIKVGDRIVLKTMDTGKDNPMYYAEEAA